MPETSVPWGQEELTLELPVQWSIQQLATGSLKPASPDWPQRLAVAINQPVAGLSLPKLLAARRKGRIVLIVEDATRHSPLPQILEVVLREVRHAGIGTEQLEIFFASGMHPPMTAQQVAAKIGPVGEGIPWRCNPWQDESAYVRIGSVKGLDVRIDRGVASADLRIIVGSVSAHLQAGFGGGYKMLLPGCASLETIRMLHRLGLGRRASQLVGTDSARNPMREAIDAGGAMIEDKCGACFTVQYLLDDNDLPTFITAGPALPVQQMIAKHCAAACGVVVQRPADVLIANAYPRDFDLWQSFKAIANAQWAVKPNGPIICLSRCLHGLNGMKPPRRWPLSPQATRKALRLLGPDALTSMFIRLLPRMAGDAAFFIRMAARVLHRNPILMVARSLTESGASFPGIELFAEPAHAVEAARKLTGETPQRVVIFPTGGTTFTIPPSQSGLAKSV